MKLWITCQLTNVPICSTLSRAIEMYISMTSIILHGTSNPRWPKQIVIFFIDFLRWYDPDYWKFEHKLDVKDHLVKPQPLVLGKECPIQHHFSSAVFESWFLSLIGSFSTISKITGVKEFSCYLEKILSKLWKMHQENVMCQ